MITYSLSNNDKVQTLVCSGSRKEGKQGRKGGELAEGTIRLQTSKQGEAYIICDNYYSGGNLLLVRLNPIIIQLNKACFLNLCTGFYCQALRLRVMLKKCLHFRVTLLTKCLFLLWRLS